MNPIYLPGFHLLPGMLVTVKGRRIPFRIGASRMVGRGKGRHESHYLVHTKLGIGLWTSPHYPEEITGIVVGDAATGGCLALLLGDRAGDVAYADERGAWDAWTPDGYVTGLPTIGAAYVAVAVALGRWPG